MNKLPMTAAGHSVLEEELKRRIQVERPRLIQRIQEAIADNSNLAENSEYQAAETEREINENRIAARIKRRFSVAKPSATNTASSNRSLRHPALVIAHWKSGRRRLLVNNPSICSWRLRQCLCARGREVIARVLTFEDKTIFSM